MLSVDADGLPVGPSSSAPSISEDGGVVAFESGEVGDDPRVWVSDRVSGSLTAVAELHSRAPGISGDGCVVVYLVPTDPAGVAPASAALTVVDRCAADPDAPLPLGTSIDTVEAAPDQLAPPVVSFDGATIAWSTGEEIRRYVRSTDGAGDFLRADTFDTELDATPGGVTGTELDISADGSTIVYVAGDGPEAFAPTPANVYVWRQADPAEAPGLEVASWAPDGQPGASDSTSPSVSADGSLVVFGSSATDLAAVDGVDVVAPFVVAYDLLGRTQRVVLENAVRPVVAGGAEHVVYERDGALHVLSLTPDGAAGDDRTIDELATAAPTGRSAVSTHARWIVFTSTTLPGPSSATTSVWAADLLAGDDSVLDTTTTTAPPDPTVPTTTAPGTPAIDGPAVFVPPVTSSFPPVRVPSVPVVAPFPLSPSSGSSRGVSSLGPVVPTSSAAGIVASPSAVVFEPTIIGAGRRTELVEFTNVSAGTVTVTSIAIDSAGPFEIVTDECTGPLFSGGRCAVGVRFAPTALGSATGSLTVRLADGSSVPISLAGEGSPQPTLDVVPAVAGQGQTVTVFGVGFPAGEIVELGRAGIPGADRVAVDPDGTFAHVIVVLPNTPTGPRELTVFGRPDGFDDVVGEVLVSSRGADSAGVATRAGTLGRP